MNIKYKVVMIITGLLLGLSLVTSLLNYIKSLEQTRTQLVDVSLPLSITNIYTEVQKNIIEPNLISSMMAHDTFVKDWLKNDEENVFKIKEYLSAVKEKYKLLNTFLVSSKTKKYYTSNGYIETLDEKVSHNKWYFNFKQIDLENELNLDFNSYIDDTIIMFMNYKIFDDSDELIGVTGVAVKTSYIDSMLKSFKEDYNFKVFFMNKFGEVVLSQKNSLDFKNISEISELSKISPKIYSSNKKIEYIKNDEKYVLSSKYIKELGLYLIVEAKIDSFMQEVRNTFYLNLIFSLVITTIIIFIIVNVIRNYNKKLEYLASYDKLTAVPNRRKFTENFENSLLLFNRENTDESIIFFDIDNFKKLNDTYGHLTGDKVLKRIGEILNSDIRKSDFVSRWGGEEFAILCNNIDVKKAEIVAEKLRFSLENDKYLNKLISKPVTASFGVTQFKKDDDYDSIVTRVDEALYEAKKSGKNQVKVKL